MKCRILHESRGRLRVHLFCGRMTPEQADLLQGYLEGVPGVTGAAVYERTQDAVLTYTAGREAVVAALARFRFQMPGW